MNLVERYPSGRRVFKAESLDGNGHARLREEIEQLGTELLWGEPLEVVKDTVIQPNKGKKVRFRLSPESLPVPKVISSQTKKMFIRAHVRSRFAHIKQHIGVEFVDEVIQASERNKFVEKGIEVDLPVVNHGSRPVLYRAGVRPVHLFAVPPASRVVGEELDSMLGPGKPIDLFGDEGGNWFKYSETTAEGEVLQGIYLRVDRRNRVWIPDSDDIIDLPDFPSFFEARQWMQENLFKRIDDPVFPMPQNHIWVGDTMPMQLPDGIYGILDNTAYVDVGLPTFQPKGMQSESPLLEARSDTYRVEIQGPADWVLLRFARGQIVVG